MDSSGPEHAARKASDPAWYRTSFEELPEQCCRCDQGCCGPQYSAFTNVVGNPSPQSLKSRSVTSDDPFDGSFGRSFIRLNRQRMNGLEERHEFRTQDRVIGVVPAVHVRDAGNRKI